ncbi:NADPH-dependent FMN reductase [Reichenbachiella ulvae]|uniref:NAD(P)H-dependent oxidoreductase n=1 Tax=Reichenbachiella ulvae TaxID=2980104 RepID=A0ABT3CVQ3_9BACT|nr:NAD(P)H-dependent oxidoreductase [Reichenbachiella ulvae]MCV9387776.1 NAD(P)H-dependent oxidoreductase [Reichenbachiella ulvae]
MKKIVAFGASNSSKSINRRFVSWAGKQVPEAELTVLDLNDYEMPIFSQDREKATGIPSEAIKFKDDFRDADGLMISFAEHNGNYTAAFKNIFDWASRVEPKTWLEKPMFLMATSDGARGAQTVLKIATTEFPFRGGEVTSSFSLPHFSDKFDDEEGIKDDELKAAFDKELKKFIGTI